jgi:hypothetical protein
MSKLSRVGIPILVIGALVFTLAPAQADPMISFNTNNNEVIISSPVGDPGVPSELGLPKFSVSGVYVLDAETTVVELKVTFSDALGVTTVDAVLGDCDEEAGNCAWSADVPFPGLGPATLTADLTDSNEATASESIDVIIV